MIKEYLNQTATWKSKTGNDGYGQPTYGTGTTINCRWEDKQRLIRTSQGVEIVSRAICYCVENVQENDLLTFGGQDYIVVQATDQPGLNGTINHREVYTYEQG